MVPLVLTLTFLTSCPLSGQEVPDTLAAARVTGIAERRVAAPSDTVTAERLLGSVSVAEALKGAGGLQVKDYGGVGGLKTVDVRSLGSAHTAVFLDGIAVDNARNTQVDLGRFSTEGVAAVSLFNGQAASVLMSAREYGSASVLYLESVQPRFGKERNHLHASVRAGSFGTFSPSVTWECRTGKRTSLRATLEGMATNGRYPFRARHFLQADDGSWRGYDTTLIRENGDLASLRADVHIFGDVNRGEWSLRAFGYLSERGYPGPVVRRPEAVPLSAERQEDGDFFVQGNFRKRLGTRYGFRLRGKWAELRTHYATHPERNPMAIPYDNHYRQHQGYVSAAHHFSLTPAFSLQGATDLSYNALDADIARFVRPSRITAAVAGAARLDLRSLHATASLLWTRAGDRFDAAAETAGAFHRENRARTSWAPALIVAYDPWKWLSVSGFVKRSCRMPSFDELYYALVGNSGLLPEYADQADLTVRLAFPAGPWSFGLSAEGWRNRVTDKIVALPMANQFRWSMYNIGKADITGAEAALSLRYGEKGRSEALRGGFSLRYTFQRALDRTDPSALSFGGQIPYVPRHSATVMADVSWRALSAEWTTLLTGRRFSGSVNLPEYAVAPWEASDLRISCRFAGFRRCTALSPLTLRLSLNNLFGAQYEIVRGYPMPGFNGMLTAAVAF